MTAVAATVTGDNNCIIAEQDKNARAEIVCLLYIYISETHYRVMEMNFQSNIEAARKSAKMVC